jgi:hypothetical protein
MAKPNYNTRRGLKDYVLRNLGHPVINVELDDLQMDDFINTAIEEFLPYCDDGHEKRFKVLQLECGKTSYQMTDDVYSILGLYQSNYLDYSPAPSDLFSINQYMANDMMIGGLGKMDILSLELVQEQISTLGVVFGQRIEFEYNEITKELYLHADPKSQTYFNDIGGNNLMVFMEFYKKLNYELFNDNEENPLYGHYWIQQICVAYGRIQWAMNLMKYNGSTLPNGMTLNPEAQLQKGQDSVENLMRQLHEENKFSDPVDFFIG